MLLVSLIRDRVRGGVREVLEGVCIAASRERTPLIKDIGELCALSRDTGEANFAALRFLFSYKRGTKVDLILNIANWKA